jgi:hypothetical protein
MLTIIDNRTQQQPPSPWQLSFLIPTATRLLLLLLLLLLCNAVGKSVSALFMLLLLLLGCLLCCRVAARGRVQQQVDSICRHDSTCCRDHQMPVPMLLVHCKLCSNVHAGRHPLA